MLKCKVVRTGFISVIGVILLSFNLLMGEGRMDERPTRPDSRIAGKRVTPLQINYQGYLASSTDTAGLTGSYNMSFRLYKVAEGGSPIWSENHSGVQVDKGVFNVYLGELNPIPADLFDGNPLWLEIQVETQILSPRKKIVSVGYSIRSQFADSAMHADTADFASNAVGVSVPLSLSGSVASPKAILTVDNTGTGSGVYVGDAGNHGVCVGNVGDNGFWVNNAGSKGFVVDNAGDDGVWVGIAGGDGLYMYDAGNDGVHVRSAGRYGFYVDSVGGDGIHVEHATNWAGYFSGKLYTSDRIGIGTTTPKNKLDVEGGMVVGSAYSGTSTAPTNGLLVQGNVGIGTTSPAARLEATGGTIGVWGKGSTMGGYFSDADGTSSARLGYGSWGIHTGYDGYFGGNVGIGTVTPGDHRLYVKSSGSGVSGATAYIQNTHTNGLAMIVEATSNDLPLLVSQKGDGPILRCDSWTGGWHPVFKVENDGTTECSVLRITGGSDLSEQFDIKSTEGEVKPGMLVCIDPEHPGKLIVSRKAYDRRVAGIISGAGGIETGMLMGQKDSKANGSYPVALTGRVYCWADASYGAIEPGDLLTTSNTPGHAMKVADYARAQGAIIGKAMSSLEKGQGLVLVLVTLQ